MPAHSDSTPTAATTKTVEKVLGALRAHPGATSAQVADAAGVGGSTAAKALSSLASHGQVSRTPGIRAGGKRAPDQWHAAQPPDQPAAEPATQASVEPAEQPPVEKALAGDKKGKAARPKPAAKAGSTGAGRTRDDTANAGRGQRLKSGALRGQVEQYLADHPEAAYTPTALGHLLGRSSGAIANALEKLAADNYAVLVTSKPRTYRSAPPE